ncbi:hypothetical protein [Microbacterium sp. NPDC056234]|uniref:amidohydrolase family protein n=1 Tax=Microbacterium sp. NPDC056234 TaxID=3345757 RepID=UPI0035E3027A
MTLIVTNARLWVAPDEPICDPTTLTVRAGVVVSIGPVEDRGVGATVVDAGGRVVTAGFWNSHVHFTEPIWRDSRGTDGSRLQAALDDMLLSRGFTTVLDLSSDPRTTFALARRVETGELRGPAIHTAGSGLYPAAASRSTSRRALRGTCGFCCRRRRRRWARGGRWADRSPVAPG